MKIVQIIDSLNSSGGVNSFVYDLCLAMKEADQDVILIGILGDKEKAKKQAMSVRVAGIPVHCLCMSSKKQAIAFGIPKLRKLIKEISCDEPTICNLHLKLSVLMGGLATVGLKNVKCVETYHNTYHHYHLEFFLMQPRIKKYITVSETAKQEMYDRFHAPKAKVVAAPNGVDREKLRGQVSRFGHEGDFLSIISVGRLSYEKNFIVPVKALSTMCNEKIRYTLIGDGPQSQEIQEAALGNPYIRFLGAVPRQTVLEELAAADIIIMPSLWEGRSILQLEAMAFDLPMVISDVPGLREPFDEKELRDGEKFRACKFGYLVRTNETDAYQRVIEKISANIEGLILHKKYIADSSRKTDLRNTVQKYIDAYTQVSVRDK